MKSLSCLFSVITLLSLLPTLQASHGSHPGKSREQAEKLGITFHHPGKAIGGLELTFHPRLNDRYVAYVANANLSEKDLWHHWDAIREALKRNDDLRGRCGFGKTRNGEPQFDCSRYLRDFVSNIHVNCTSEDHCEVYTTLYPGKTFGALEITFYPRLNDRYMAYVASVSENDLRHHWDAIHEALKRNDDLRGRCGFGKSRNGEPQFDCSRYLRDFVSNIHVNCTSEDHCEVYEILYPGRGVIDNGKRSIRIVKGDDDDDPYQRTRVHGPIQASLIRNEGLSLRNRCDLGLKDRRFNCFQAPRSRNRAHAMRVDCLRGSNCLIL